MNKITMVLILLTFGNAEAGERKHHSENKHEKQTVQNIYEVNNSVSGVATSIATGQHSFGFDVYSLQGSIGFGNYNGSQALSFGVAKRIGRVMYSGSVASESGTEKYSFGAGINWRF